MEFNMKLKELLTEAKPKLSASDKRWVALATKKNIEIAKKFGYELRGNKMIPTTSGKIIVGTYIKLGSEADFKKEQKLIKKIQDEISMETVSECEVKGVWNDLEDEPSDDSNIQLSIMCSSDGSRIK